MNTTLAFSWSLTGHAFWHLASKESFTKAAENAVAEAAKTVRGLKWARVAEFEMVLDDKKIVEYRALTRIYFNVEH